MKEKGIIAIPFLGAIIAVVLVVIVLAFITATIKFTNTGLLLVIGFILLFIAYNAKEAKFQERLTYVALIVLAASLLFGSLFAIIGTPFLIKEYTTSWSPSCAFAYCNTTDPPGMEGTYVSGQFSSPYFAETFLNESDSTQNFDVRAATCETLPGYNNGTGLILGANSHEWDFFWTTQILTQDGKWIDYYVGHTTYENPTTFEFYQVLNVYKVLNSNEYVRFNTGQESIDLTENQRFITNKVRCRLDASYEIPRYGGSITINNGLLKVYGTTHEPTCSDGIKNQDETEIDYGGVCGTGNTNPDVCGDGYCTGNETTASCPTDCSSNDPEPDPEPTDCDEGFHWETIDGQQQCIANLIPNNNLLIVTGIGLLGLLISVYLIFWRK